jgi:hypothetical protein
VFWFFTQGRLKNSELRCLVFSGLQRKLVQKQQAAEKYEFFAKDLPSF